MDTREQVPRLIWEEGAPGRRAATWPAGETEIAPGELAELPDGMLRAGQPALPEVSQLELERHWHRLASRNYSLLDGIYPLGSCTMKYNPAALQEAARSSWFASQHPLAGPDDQQGLLQTLYELEQYLAEIGGVARVSLQPAAGAQGELAGLLIIRAYYQQRGEGHRRQVIIPDSAHGTNPASAAMAGFEVVQVDSNSRGEVDLQRLQQLVGDNTAALMLTNPNTLGLMETQILGIAQLIHAVGGQLYYDGANLNALLGVCRPGDMGFDVVHFNLHKTFGAPHGGGGPGAGPVGVQSHLVDYLPRPLLQYDPNQHFYWWDASGSWSIGRVRAWYGNIDVLVKAWAYIRLLGPEGLRRVSRYAVLNANYLAARLQPDYPLAFDRPCMHEFVVHPRDLPPGIHTLDVAKRLMDYGWHPPTIYFPLVVKEAMMFEPAETESLEQLDALAASLQQIAVEWRTQPELLAAAPQQTSLERLDEVRAARCPQLRGED